MWRTGSRHHAGVRLHLPCTPCWARAIPSKFQKAAHWILDHQNEDGGWRIFPGGPSDVSASVKAYFALKLAGYSAQHPALARARSKILELGGPSCANTFTKIYLCFFGQYDWYRRARDSAGDRAVSQLVLVQHLRDFLLVARHSRAAGHRVRQEAVQEDSAGDGRRGAVSGRARQLQRCYLHWDREAAQLAQFLPGPGSRDALAGARAHPAAALRSRCAPPKSGCWSASR